MINRKKYRVDYSGEKFGRLKVLSFYRRTGEYSYWNCKCDCGKTKKILITALIGGSTKSCGCLNKELITTHGQSRAGKRTRWYRTWGGMMSRCYNARNKDYIHYGAKGVVVCDEWKNPINFLNWCKSKQPIAKGMSLDRYPDCTGPYSPENCRFATATQQIRNRRTTVMVTIKGQTMSRVEAIERYGAVTRRCVIFRMNVLGWNADDAITKPYKPIGKFTKY